MGNYIPFRKTNTALKPQPSGYIPFGKSVQPIGETNLGLPEIGGVEITTPAIVSQKEKEKIGIKETLKYLTPQTISEAGGKVFGAIGQFGKTIGQSIARSFVSMGTELREQLLVPKAERKQFGEATYTPQNETEKKIFGTDKPINFKTIGEETLAIGGEDFKNKWGNYSIPVGMLIAGLDITPFGGGKKQVLEVAAKTISKTQDVVEIAKTLKTILRGSDEEIEILAKSLKMVNKENEILKVIETAGKAKQATPIAQKATKLGVSAEKGIIPTKGIAEVTRATKVASLSRERGFISSVKETAPIKISGQYIPRDTDSLAIRAKNLIKTDIATAEKMALTGTDDNAVATAAELIKHYEELAVKTTDKAAKSAYYDKVAEIAVEIAPKLTEQGKAIQAASILGRQTPEGQLRFAARTIQKYNETVEATKRGILGLKKKVPELTGKQAESILSQMKKVKEMPDGVDKAMAFKKLQDEIADLVPSPWYKKLINLWKAGLLTGLKTSGLNDFSNLFHGISEVIKDIPATGVDSVASLFTGERTTVFTLRGIKDGGKEGFWKGVRYMKTGFDERNVAIKLDWRRISFGKSKFAKALQTYEETVFHLMGAQDQPFYYGAKARSLSSQAIAQGKNSKLKGNELQKFVQNLIENPTDEMLKYAVNDAEISVFQNKTALGTLARGIQKIGGGVGEIVVPFGRTPSAVAMQIVNYSPAGIVKTIVENIGKGRFDQRLFSQGIGRGIVGTGAMFIGMKMFKNDLISLDYPTSERKKNQWELEGRKPNSFKTPDGKWRSVLPLGPAGMLLILGGQLQKSLDDTGSLASSLLEAAPSTLKSFSEQTFLVGVNNFAKALNDPGRYAENVAARTFGSTIPTIVSDVAMSTDPLQRRTYSKTEGFTAPLKGRTPGLRQTLEPSIDVFGSPLARTGNVLEIMLDPTRPTRIKSSKLIDELRRLFDAGYPATPTRFADEKTYTDVLTPEQITYLQERAGLILEGKLTNLIEAEEYKKLDDDAKARKIQNFTEKARVVARAETIEELTQGLEGTDFNAKMSELKASGFMTKQVFDEWKKLFR